LSYFIDSEENIIKKHSIAFDKDLNVETRNLILPIDLLLQVGGPTRRCLQRYSAV